jgi:glycosyltransferase involved in cell wall biosynthesis
MIPTYNCANYLRDTLESILKQDPGRDIMQIEVIDDHSIDDNPEAIVRELAGDRVSFYRQPKNVGYIKNFNTCLQRSRGELIHLLHGDDCVREGFYLKMQQGFNEKPEIGAAFSRYISMDQNGHWQWLSQLEQPSSGVLDHWLDQIAIINRIFPPSIVVRRNVYEKLGGYDSRISCCGEDWEMWVRIAANYPIWYEVEPLALYRSHSSSLTGRCARSGQNVRDLRQIIEIIQSCLPLTKATYLSQKARENCAIYAIKSITPKFVAMGDWDAVKIQIQEALRCSCSLKVLQELALMVVRMGKNWNKNLIKAKNAVST